MKTKYAYSTFLPVIGLTLFFSLYQIYYQQTKIDSCVKDVGIGLQSLDFKVFKQQKGTKLEYKIQYNQKRPPSGKGFVTDAM